jgi:hypothetical protein
MKFLRWLLSFFSSKNESEFDTGQDPPYPRNPDKPKTQEE